MNVQEPDSTHLLVTALGVQSKECEYRLDDHEARARLAPLALLECERAGREGPEQSRSRAKDVRHLAGLFRRMHVDIDCALPLELGRDAAECHRLLDAPVLVEEMPFGSELTELLREEVVGFQLPGKRRRGPRTVGSCVREEGMRGKRA